MKYAITAAGHSATADIEMDGKGGFSLSIISADFGNGSGGGSITGDHLTGSVNLDGHNAALDATIEGSAIAGTMDPGWFFPTIKFAGTKIT
jgi:hypothetical protein